MGYPEFGPLRKLAENWAPLESDAGLIARALLAALDVIDFDFDWGMMRNVSDKARALDRIALEVTNGTPSERQDGTK